MSREFLEELKSINEWIVHVQKQMEFLGNKIKKEFDLPQLKGKLLGLPEQIKKTQIIALQKKAELSEFEQEHMKQREAEILFEINNEKGENGKAKFTNDPARKAELIIRLGEDEHYSDLRIKRSAIEFKVWEFEAETDRLRKEFQAREAIKDLIVAELKLYTK